MGRAWAGGGTWFQRRAPLLYNLDKLTGRPDAPVVVCEGGKLATPSTRSQFQELATSLAVEAWQKAEVAA
jgi:hypothetical protein